MLRARQTVLSARLDCEADGGRPDLFPLIEDELETPALQRWNEAAFHAICAALIATGHLWENDDCPEKVQTFIIRDAKLLVMPPSPPNYQRMEAWIDAYLTRLIETGFRPPWRMTYETAEQAWRDDGQGHPV